MEQNNKLSVFVEVKSTTTITEEKELRLPAFFKNGNGDVAWAILRPDLTIKVIHYGIINHGQIESIKYPIGHNETPCKRQEFEAIMEAAKSIIDKAVEEYDTEITRITNFFNEEIETHE